MSLEHSIFPIALLLFACIVVCIIALQDVKKHRINANKLNAQQVELLERLDMRLSGMEERMANIETLVVEKERHEKFDVLQDV